MGFTRLWLPSKHGVGLCVETGSARVTSLVSTQSPTPNIRTGNPVLTNRKRTGSPPIISRIIQFLGDGMIYYNQARKVMFIPFPFPHAQLSVVFILMAIPFVAVLMEQFSDVLWLSCLLAFLTVTCLSGIHEVARELENPFRNVPNEIPLVTLQAQFNESLVTMFSGYHPDHFWHHQARDEHGDCIPSTEATPTSKPPLSNTQLLEVLKHQMTDMEQQMRETGAEQQRELDRQKREIQFLRSQLRKPRSPVAVIEEKKTSESLFTT